MSRPEPYPHGKKCRVCHKLESHYLDELAVVVCSRLRTRRFWMRWSKVVGAVLTLMLAVFGGVLIVMEARALGGAEWLGRIDGSDLVIVQIVLVYTFIIWRCVFRRGLD